MYYKYKAYELIWFFKNFKIDEFKSINVSDSEYDVKIEESFKKWNNLPESSKLSPFLSVFRKEIRLEINGIAKFRIIDGKEIFWIRDNPLIDDKDIKIFLLGTVMSCILMQRNFFLLHGNVLEKNNKAIICLGNSGAGKSTIAYFLMQNGWKVLSDDIAAINQKGQIYPGIPRIKLWEDAIDEFNINKTNLQTIRKGHKKYLLDYSLINTSNNICQLKNIYILNRTLKTYSHKEPMLENITSQKSKTLLIRNHIYRKRIIRALNKEKDYFIFISYIQKQIQLNLLNIPEGINNFPKIFFQLVNNN